MQSGIKYTCNNYNRWHYVVASWHGHRQGDSMVGNVYITHV